MGAVQALIARLCKVASPPEQIGLTDWARERRKLSSKSSAIPGSYNPDLTPWIEGIHSAIDDPAVRKIAAQKSAQIAWTDGVILNYIAKKIDVDPSPMIVMFAKEKAAKEFNDEKFIPMVEVTNCLHSKLDVTKKKDRESRWDFKQFPGGFLKLVGSNSPSSVKSTPSPVVVIEEPDDCNDNIKEQGDTITLLEERTKTYARSKVIFGGTPTVKGTSRIASAYEASDKRVFMVPCHACGEAHVLAWENVRYTEDPEFNHEVFGHIRPETAKYACPHCGVLWNDAEKNKNVKRAMWVATAPFYGIAGFYLNELYSPFPGSTLKILVEKYLTANHALEQGDDTKMRSFINSSLGMPYEYKSDLPEAAALAERAEEYEERTVPWGGLILTAGVDVQHNRLAVVIRAWGKGMESWLVYWGEIHGQTLIPNQGAWVELDYFLDAEFQHASGNVLKVKAVSVDSSDGTTTDAVYAYVRKRAGKNYMAIKGASETGSVVKEIYSKPQQSIDTDKRHKPHPSGVRPYIVGTTRAKDLILEGRIKLTGNGPGRLHWYKSVRPDYWDQITSEIKVPHKTVKNRKVWQKKSGARNEALDAEVYALHAAHSLKLHLIKPSQWLDMEISLRQRAIFAPVVSEETPTEAPEVSSENQPNAVHTSAQPDIEPQPSPVNPPPVQRPMQQRARARRRPTGYSATSF